MNIKNSKKGHYYLQTLLIAIILGILVTIMISIYEKKIEKLRQHRNEAYRVAKFMPVMEKVSPGALVEFTNNVVMVVTHVMQKDRRIVLSSSSGVLTPWHMTNLATSITSIVQNSGAEIGLYNHLSERFIRQFVKASTDPMMYSPKLESAR